MKWVHLIINRNRKSRLVPETSWKFQDSLLFFNIQDHEYDVKDKYSQVSQWPFKYSYEKNTKPIQANIHNAINQSADPK